MHRLDPRTKALMFAAVVATALIAGRMESLAVICLGGGLAVTLAGPAGTHVRGLVRLLAVLVIAALLLNSLFTAGRPLPGPSGAPLWPTFEGVSRGAVASLRLTSMACVAFALVTTTCPRRLGEAIEGVLGRISALRGAGLAMDVASRFIPDFIRDANRVRAIRSVRVDRRGIGLLGRLKEAGSTVLPLMILAVRRSERLADAMAARCYDGPRGRSAMAKPGTRRADWIALLGTAALCAVALLLGDS